MSGRDALFCGTCAAKQLAAFKKKTIRIFTTFTALQTSMTSNPHIRLITAVAAKFLVLNSKFDRVPHPWQRQPSRRKISCRQVVVLFGASRSRGCWYEPDSRCRPTQSHASQPQTHAVCSPRAELESLVHHPIFRPLHYHFVENRILVGFVS